MSVGDPITPALGVPLYAHPATSPDVWASVARAADVVSFAVVNVDNGPGPVDEPLHPDYVDGVRCLQDAGVRLVGYVDTAYGERAVEGVAADIDRWRARFGIDGVMLDRAAVSAADDLVLLLERARRAGLRLVVANPGRPVADGWDCADVVCELEAAPDVLLGHVSQVVESGRGPSRRWVVVHSIGTRPRLELAMHAASLADHVYVTDHVMPHPYGGGLDVMADCVRAVRALRRARCDDVSALP